MNPQATIRHIAAPTRMIPALCAALLTSCASLVPPLPNITAPASSSLSELTACGDTSSQSVYLGDIIRSPQLKALVHEGLAENRDLRVTALNVQRARALYRLQESDLYPQVSARGESVAGRSPSGPSASNALIHSYGAGLSIASWEFDLFGRLRSLRDSAMERYLASDATRQAAEISLIAQIVASYLQLAADQEQLALASDTYNSRLASFALQKQVQDVGLSSALEISRAESELEEISEAALRWRAAVARSRSGLELLVGTPLNPGLVVEPVSQIVSSAALPGRLCSTVLAARPDVRAAEHELIAANADIGAARAAFFPNITLTGAVGSASGALDTLFESGTKAWSFIPSMTVPIFNRRGIRASLRATTASRDIALSSYEGAIQRAFREMADVLADRRVLSERISSKRRQVAAANRTMDSVGDQYSAGVVGQIELLDAQRVLFGAESSLIAVSLEEKLNLIDLYRALGGSWNTPVTHLNNASDITAR